MRHCTLILTAWSVPSNSEFGCGGPPEPSGPAPRSKLAALQRPASEAEQRVLRELVSAERARFTSDAEAAGALIRVGIAPVATDLDPVEVATWSQVGRALLNLHETITRP